MDSEKNTKTVSEVSTKKSWWRADPKWIGGYIVAGAVWYYSEKFRQTTIDSIIVLVIAIAAGFFFYRIHAKLGSIKNYILRDISAFFIVLIIAGAAIGFLTAIANNWQAVAVRTPLGSQIATADAAQLTQLNNDLKTYEANFQTSSDQIRGTIDEQTNSKAVFQNNINDYQELQKLTDEQYAKFAIYVSQITPILSKYSSDLSGDTLSGLATASVNTQNAYDDIFNTKIAYYQALFDGKSSAQVETARLAANDAVDRFTPVQQASAQALQRFQTAYNAFLGN